MYTETGKRSDEMFYKIGGSRKKNCCEFERKLRRGIMNIEHEQ